MDFFSELQYHNISCRYSFKFLKYFNVNQQKIQNEWKNLNQISPLLDVHTLKSTETNQGSFISQIE